MDLQHARDVLNAELADLDERTRSALQTRADVSPDPEGPDEASVHQMHPGDDATDVADRTDADLLLDTIGDRRRRVIAALARLDEGSYGRCTVCGREIDEERLEARPWTGACREHADATMLA